MAEEKPLIFISCGQVTDAEKRLGEAIRDLVDSTTNFRAYYAENQSDLDGLTNHIFRNLHEAQGLIAVMHERGKVTDPRGGVRTRASVWIEQEIAIAAFMRHVLQKSIHVALFTRDAVALEGVREKLILNPLVFDNENEVLEQLRVILPKWHPFAPTKEYAVTYRYTWRPTRVEQNVHEYEMVFYVKNDGKQRASDYRLEVDFPTTYLYDTEKGDGHRKFVFAQDQFPPGRQILYPTDEREAFKIGYYVNTRNYSPEMLRKAIIGIALFSGDMPPAREEVPLYAVQNF